jgi:hypothetical protein
LQIDTFIGISATRLRYETENISCSTYLFFGQNDKYRPHQDWFNLMKIQGFMIENENHEMYRKQKIASMIVKTVHSHTQKR